MAKIRSNLHPDKRLSNELCSKPDVSCPGTDLPWWQDEKYNVGMETTRPIDVHVTNPIIKETATIKVRQ